MNDLKIPAGHQALMPYLIVTNAIAFRQFLITVFGAEETEMHRRDENLIMHAEVKVNGSTIMYCDATGEWQTQGAGMFIYVANADETYQKALAAGATSIMELEDKEYGRAAGIKDAFGNTWWITSIAV